jgi:hypothetical protein
MARSIKERRGRDYQTARMGNRPKTTLLARAKVRIPNKQENQCAREEANA